MDMGPYYLTMMVNLMGPVRRVQAVATSGQSERLITADGPKRGTRFKVGTPTSVLSLLEFTLRRDGDVRRIMGCLPPFQSPDRTAWHQGIAAACRTPTRSAESSPSPTKASAWDGTDTSTLPYGAVNWPVDAPDRANYRMLGLADLARAVIEKRSPRASGDLALHVLEVMEAILRAAETGTSQVIPGMIPQPKELGENEAKNLLA